MSGITEVVAYDNEWAVIADTQSAGHGGHPVEFWLCNFSSSTKSFSVDLPSLLTPITANVTAGSKAIVRESLDYGVVPTLKYRWVSFSDSYWELRLFDGDTWVDSAHFTVT